MKKLFLVLVCLFTALRLCAFTPSPYTEAVTFTTKLTTFTGTNGTGSPVSSSGGGSLTVVGEDGGNAYSNTNGVESSTLGMAWLRPGKEYYVTYAGAYSGSGVGSGVYSLSFTAPNGYALYINETPLDPDSEGVRKDLVTGLFPGTSSPSYTYSFNVQYKIELRPVSNGARADAGSFSGIELGKSVTWEVGLGGLRSGQSAGRIFFKEKDFSNSQTSRERLYYTEPVNAGQIKVVKDGLSNQTLRQLSTPQTVVDLVDVTSDGYWIKFYTPAQATWSTNIYTFTGSPWRTIRVQAPNSNQLKITETEGSVSRVSLLELTSGSYAGGDPLWTLQEGDTSTWLRTTTHANTNNGGTPVTRDDLVTVRTGGTSGTIVAQTKYCYTHLGWGEELTEIVADPNGTALATTYTYHDSNTAYGNYRKVKTVKDATGNWTSSAYYDDWNRRGRLSLQTRPDIDTPSTAPAASLSVGNSVSFDYAADTTDRYTIETSQLNYTGNVQTGKQVTTRTIALTQNGVNFTRHQVDDYSAAAASVQTTSEIADAIGSDPDMLNLPFSAKRADQSQDSYAYYRGSYSGTTFTVSGSGDFFRTNVWHGSTNSSGATAFTAYDSATVTSVYLIANQSTMDVIVKNPAGLVVRQETHVYTGGTSFSLISYQDFTYDDAGRCTQSVASNGATSSWTYSNGQLTSSTDASGLETGCTYDKLGRVASQRRVGAAAGTYAAQADVYSYFTYDGANHVVESVTTDASTKPTFPGGSLDLFTTATYDLAGRVTAQVANAGASNTAHRFTTGYAYNPSARTATVTLPGGATKISTANLDGSLQSVTGTGVVGEFLTYSVDSSSGNRKTERQAVSTSEPVLGTTTRDWLGRTTSIVTPGWNGGTMTQTSYYNSLGQLYKVSSPGVADTLYTYDTLGGIVLSGLDVSGDGSLTTASTDRISERSWTFFTTGGNWWRRDTSSTYATASSGTATQLGKTETQLSGLATNRLSYAQSTDIFGNVTAAYTDVDRSGKTGTSTTDTPDSTTNAVQIAYNGRLMSAQDTAGVIMKYGYDALGRTNKTIDPRTAGTGTTPNGTVTAYFAGSSLASSITYPATVTQAAYTYDSAGRVATVTNVLGKVARYDYTTLGQKLHEWGDTAYPLEYVYDSYGRQKHLKTYRAGTNWDGTTWPTSTTGTADFTFWDYETATGLLKAKYDAANLDSAGAPITTPTKVSYTYTAAGQPSTRTNQRGLVTSYAYSATTGELTGISYSDTTPAVSYTYNRLGAPATVTDATTSGVEVRTFNYNLTGTLELQSEDLPASYFTNRRLTSTYATSGVVGRTTGLQLGTSGTPTADQSLAYTYQTDGRLSTIAGGGQTFTYGYATNSHLISTVTNSGVNYTDTRLYDATHDWTDSRETTWGASPVSLAKFAYTQDEMGRTTQTAKTGELFNRYGTAGEGLQTTYGYDARSQLTAEQTKIGATNTVLAGRDNGTTTGTLGFVYDNLGNRISATHNSNAANYTSNAINQYTQRDVPAVFDVAGGMASAATVTVNGSSSGVTQQDGYFFKGQSMASTSTAPAYAALTVSDGITHIGGADLGTVGVAWQISAAADFNGDGQTDILLQNTTTGQRYIWWMNGATNTGGADLGIVALAWSIVAAADFNGDGQTDILLQNTTTGQRYIWWMNGATNTGGTDLGIVALAWSMVAAADFNGDGETDILLQNTTTGQRYIWWMNGATNTGGDYLDTVAIAWSMVAAADFNGDGHTDILLQNTTTGQRYVWLMNGATNIGGIDLGTLATAQSINAAGDFNSDGHPDIVWTDTSNGDRYVWFMTGSTAQVPAFVAAQTEGFTYDADGNLTRDGRWVYEYDAENRLIVMFTRGAPDDPLVANSANAAVWNSGVARQKLQFNYDYLGRRVAKVASTYGTGSWMVDDNLRFVWNGWNLIALLDADNGNALVASYYWGLDLSGTGQGAGGVGGLLLTKEAGNSYLPAYDGMGNVHAMIKASDGSIAAAYEYDAFGKTLRESGPYAAANPFRYSTKYTDTETSLVYYGHRYYSPSMGRFINRDPIEEAGGVNLYGFCGNNGVNSYDYLGMYDTLEWGATGLGVFTGAPDPSWTIIGMGTYSDADGHTYMPRDYSAPYYDYDPDPSIHSNEGWGPYSGGGFSSYVDSYSNSFGYVDALNAQVNQMLYESAAMEADRAWWKAKAAALKAEQKSKTAEASKNDYVITDIPIAPNSGGYGQAAPTTDSCGILTVQRLQALMLLPVQDRATIIKNLGLPAAQFTGNGPGKGLFDPTGKRTVTDLLNAALGSSGLYVTNESSLSGAVDQGVPLVLAGRIRDGFNPGREAHIVAAMPGGSIDGVSSQSVLTIYNPTGGGYDTSRNVFYWDAPKSGLPEKPSEIWTVHYTPVSTHPGDD